MTKRDKATALHALDAMGLALAMKGHRWTNTERRLYERATKALSA